MPSMMPVPAPKRDWRGVVLDVLAIVLIVVGFGGFGVVLYSWIPLTAFLYVFAVGGFAGVRLATRGR